MGPLARGLAHPVANLALRRFGGRRTLEEAAVASDTLQEVESVPLGEIVALPGAEARLTGSDTALAEFERELSRLQAPTISHGAVRRHVLENCFVHGAGFDWRGGGYRIRQLSVPRDLSASAPRIEAATYAMTALSHQFFGHWLREACSTAVLAPEGEALILDVPEAWPHARAYVEAFGLSPTAGRPLRVERLTVYTDNSYGSHRVARMRTLRARLGTGARGARGRLYLERGAAGSPRGLADTDGFHAALQRLGFQILDITAARYQEVAAAIAAADLVLAIEGSHQSHIHYHLREGGALLTLMPADRLSTIHTACALALGFRYGYVVIEPTPDGYSVDLGDLEATLALLDA